MKHFDIAQEFIQTALDAVSVTGLADAFGQAVAQLGFRHFACCTHVDPLRPPRGAVLLHSYPPAWVQAFSERGLHQIDPVFQRASRSLMPFRWDAPCFLAGLGPAQRQILDEARQHGLTHGFTVPIHDATAAIDPVASCSVVSDSPQLDPAAYCAVQLMAFYLYEAAAADASANALSLAQAVLSRRERQCLELVAEGKSDWASSRILGLSERTVHNHIENAKRRFNVSTRMQAVVQALALQQISLGDVLRDTPGRTQLRGSVKLKLVQGNAR